MRDAFVEADLNSVYQAVSQLNEQERFDLLAAEILKLKNRYGTTSTAEGSSHSPTSDNAPE